MGNVLKKSLALLLAITLLPIPAHAGVRDMIVRAKQSFEAEDEGRSARRSAAEFMKMESSRMALMAQKNQLMALERLNQTKPAPSPVSPGPVDPVNPTPSITDNPLPPTGTQTYQELSYGGGLYGALLKYGVEIHELSGDFGREFSDFVKQIFEQIALKNLEAQVLELYKKAIQVYERNQAIFFDYAYKAALFARDYAYKAVDYFDKTPIDHVASLKFLSEVDNHMNPKEIYFETPNEYGRPYQRALFADWHDTIGTFDYFGPYVDTYYLMKTAQQHSDYESGLEWFEKFKNAVDVSLGIYSLGESLAAVFSPFDRSEMDAHIAEIKSAYELSSLLMPELEMSEFNYKPFVSPKKIAYDDELGNSVEWTIDHAFWSFSKETFFSFNGKISSDIQNFISNASWRWTAKDNDGKTIELSDKYADFMNFRTDSPFLVEDVEVLKGLKVVKKIQIGLPTYWEFRNQNDALLASVSIPDSETLPENMNPIIAGRPMAIVETYVNGRLGDVQFKDLQNSLTIVETDALKRAGYSNSYIREKGDWTTQVTLQNADTLNYFPDIMSEEFKTYNYQQSLANVVGAFSIHKVLPNDNFFNNLTQYVSRKFYEKSIGYLPSQIIENPLLRILFSTIGWQDAFLNSILPERILTNLDRKILFQVQERFLQYIIADKRLQKDYIHVAIKYTPSQTEQTINRFLASVFSEIPIVGTLLDPKLPNPGEIVHTIQFHTVDEFGYNRRGKLEFTYGSFQRERRLGSGGSIVDTINGPVQVRLMVYKSAVPFEDGFYEDRPELDTGVVPFI